MKKRNTSNGGQHSALCVIIPNSGDIFPKVIDEIKLPLFERYVSRNKDKYPNLFDASDCLSPTAYDKNSATILLGELIEISSTEQNNDVKNEIQLFIRFLLKFINNQNEKIGLMIHPFWGNLR